MDELTEAVNLALDRVKSAHGFTDTELAEALGTDRMMIWRWRQGKFSALFRFLIPITVLANTPLPAGAAEQATDIRILAPLLSIPQIDA